MPIKTNDLIHTLYHEGNTATALTGSFDTLNAMVSAEITDAVLQMSASTATTGLTKWEQDLGITPPAGASMDMRRAIVLAKLLRPPTITPEQIVKIANCFAPNKDVSIVDPSGPYQFKLVIPTQTPWLGEMMESIDEAKPAHLAMTASLARDVTYTGGTSFYIGFALYKGGKQSIKPVYPTGGNMAMFWGALIRKSGNEKIDISLPSGASYKLFWGAMVRRGGKIIIGRRQ